MRLLPASTAVLISVMLSACNLGDADDSDAGDSGIGSDKTVVVYETFAPSSGRSLLYAAASDASAVHLLAPGRLTASSIEDYALSPAGTYVAYRITPLGAEPAGLYIANVYTGEITRITDRAGGPDGAAEYAWSPTGTHLAYTGGDDFAVPGRLYIYNRATDRSLQVSPGETSGHDLNSLDATPDRLEWSPNGVALAYRSYYGSVELNAIAPDGSDYRRMSGNMVAGGVVHDVIKWAPDSSRIAYLAAQDIPDMPEVFVTDFDGTGNIQLSPAFFSTGDSLALYWSPDSQYLAMAISADANSSSISLEGSAADGSHKWTIASDVSSSGVVDYPTVEWSTDSSYIAYLADRDGNGLREFYSAAVPASGIYTLSGPGPGTSPESSLAWEPMSRLIAYRHDADVAERFELYTAGPTGAARTRISGTLQADADVLDASWSTQGGKLAYRVGDSDGIRLRMFDSTTNATATVADFSRAAVLIEPEWLPRTDELVYVADAGTTNVGELYVANANGTVRKISHRIDPSAPLAGEDVVSFELFP
jgi:Tol biopolymer transport system component